MRIGHQLIINIKNFHLQSTDQTITTKMQKKNVIQLLTKKNQILHIKSN